jgi:hypothetical protein
MTDEPLDHLQEAKTILDVTGEFLRQYEPTKAVELVPSPEHMLEMAKVHALLSIAESLEIISIEGVDLTVFDVAESRPEQI